MKHNVKITIVLLLMFVLTQAIAVYVVNFYSPVTVTNGVPQNVTNSNQLPFGLQPPPVNQQVTLVQTLLYLIPAFVFAIILFFILTRFKADVILKAWFFIVMAIAMSVSLISLMPSWTYIWLIALAIAAVLAFFKVYRRNFIIHNITELLVYPGIAAIFVALLSTPENLNRGVFSIMILLVLISVYDMWAVWHSGIMQKMAKYQMNKLRIFAGFFVPYMSKKTRENVKKMKKSKGNNKEKKVKVSVALLGGGDVVFPAITAGVILIRFGFTKVLGIMIPLASIIAIAGATLGLGLLLLFSKKKKFYPAMPFISAGLFLALGICYLVF